MNAPKLRFRKDAQVKRVYKWSWDFTHWNSKQLSKRQVRKWVKWALKTFHFRKGSTPAVLFPSRGTYSSCEPDFHELSFIKKHCNVAMVLHETAHYIQSMLFGQTTENHGPEFMGLWLYLLEASDEYPRGTLTASARANKIEVDGSMGPELIKKHK